MHDTKYAGDRKDLLNLIPQTVSSVLDVGCGEGGLGKLLRERSPNVEISAIEINKKAAKEAAGYYNELVICDIQKDVLPFKEGDFDCIVCGDVLEHLYDPWSVLVVLKKFLKSDGLLIVSLPNIRYYRILRELVFRGNWTYKSSGILDWSHIRFFTSKEMKKMFESAGLNIQRTTPVIGGSKDMKRLNKLFRGRFNDLLASQYTFVLTR